MPIIIKCAQNVHQKYEHVHVHVHACFFNEQGHFAFFKENERIHLIVHHYNKLYIYICVSHSIQSIISTLLSIYEYENVWLVLCT